ncbi:MAG: UDP-N-acetylmuramyl-tripeptide synthetase, partial [Planctomycetes bacterium]|nr:UDP-N-acetylmuramyl-tripeptide synthetase [Planctomycetota bacterium]
MPAITTHTRGVSLRRVLPEAKILGAEDIEVHACCSDSRGCQPGDLFVAMEGARCDGHDYAEEALAGGAAAIIGERLLPFGAPMALVRDSREAFGRVCHALAGDPSEQMTVIGVSGSAGKTTTALLIANILEAAGARVGAMTSLGNCDSLDAAHATGRSPRPAELASWLARMHAAGCTHAVVEISHEALVKRHIAGLRLDAAVLTNVRRSQSNQANAWENHLRAQRRLFEHLKPRGFCVLNADDRGSRPILDQLSHPALTIGLDQPANVTGAIVERHASEQTFLLTAGRESAAVRTPLIGDHFTADCLTAVAAGLALGVDLPTAVRGLEAVKAVPGRLERLECGQPFGVFVDAARTPDALASTLRTLRSVTAGRLLCVFGAEGQRNRDRRPLLGRAVERYADWGIITSDNPRRESPLQIAHDVLDGYKVRARIDEFYI